MTDNKQQLYPPLYKRLFSVWYRHMRVYGQHIFSNGFPPFFEPLIFLAGVGLGLGKYIDPINGQPYVLFLAIGLLMTSSMWTAFFECTFGTFIRMEFQKTYDGMLAAPITANNLDRRRNAVGRIKGVFLFVCGDDDAVPGFIFLAGGPADAAAAQCAAGALCSGLPTR